MGCGRVGSVIDQNAEAFRKLRSGFKGSKITGIGFDRDVLIEAGIERADAFAAVSSGDNSNVISARVARESFNVDRVVARIYDPRRAEVYQRLGIPTVATVRWTADQMLRRLLPEGSEPLWRDPTGVIVLAEVMLPGPGTVLQEGDVVHVIAVESDLERVSAAFARGMQGSKSQGKGSH